MAKMTATIVMDDDSLSEARYQAMALSIRIDGIVDLVRHGGELVVRYDRGDIVPDVQLIKTDAEKIARRLADAARVLMYGDGNLNALIVDLAKALADYDDVPPVEGANKLLQISWTLHRLVYAYFSGDDWRGK